MFLLKLILLTYNKGVKKAKLFDSIGFEFLFLFKLGVIRLLEGKK